MACTFWENENVHPKLQVTHCNRLCLSIIPISLSYTEYIMVSVRAMGGLVLSPCTPNEELLNVVCMVSTITSISSA